MKTSEKPRKAQPTRASFPLEDRRWQSRSITAGIIGTILFHLLFVFSIPRSVLRIEDGDRADRFQEFDIEIISDPEEPEPQYVETNPLAPENEPDETANFSARNQQAANEELPDEISPDRTPATEGEEFPTEKIVSGDLNPPVPTFAPPEPQQDPSDLSVPMTVPSNPERIDPLPGFEDDVIVSEEGTGMTEAEEVPNPVFADEPVEGIEADTNEVRPFSPPATVATPRPTPQPRPRLPRSPPGPVRDQRAGVSQTGSVGYDAKFSQFGDYMERVVEVVTQRWHAMAAARSYRETSSTVMLEFKLRSDGSIADLDTVATNSKALGILLCRSAIEQGAPYGPWPEDMRQVLGDEQTITFTFHYW
ncbi:MAG: hypothetical protein R3F07_17750 [Opitutaceae bacterium]